MPYCHIKPLSIICFVLFLLQSCKKDGIDTESYYLPIDSLAVGKIYEFVSNGDSLPPLYWYYSKIKQGDTTFLAAQLLDQDFNVQQFMLERRVNSGMVLKSGYVYSKDSSGQSIRIPLTVNQSATFPFHVKDSSELFINEVQWPDPSMGETIVTKNRTFLKNSTINFMSKQIPSIEFSVKEAIEMRNNGSLEYKSTGLERYAQGIGLVSFEKNINETIKFSYKLAAIYTIEELRAKFPERFTTDKLN
jgi:hypothetical protein